MATSEQVQRIELRPGELFFGGGQVEVFTLLGSCVAITLWHPRYRVGGICHYLLAYRDQYKHSAGNAHGRYASDALNYFLGQLQKLGARPRDFEVKLFGGGNMFEGNPGGLGGFNVAESNVEEGKKLLAQHGFQLSKVDAGGARYRKLVFLLTTGEVWVKYGKSKHLSY